MKVLTESIFWKEHLPLKYIQIPSAVDHFFLNGLGLDWSGNAFVGSFVSKERNHGKLAKTDLQTKSQKSPYNERYEMVSSCIKVSMALLIIQGNSRASDHYFTAGNPLLSTAVSRI